MIREIALAVVLLLPLAGYGQGKLDAVRDAVDQPRSKDSSKSDSSASDSTDSSGSAAVSSEGAGCTSIGDPFDGPWYIRDRYFTPSYSIQPSVEVGNDFDGLTRVGLKLFLDTDTQLGIRTDWDYYLERLPSGSRDQLWISDVDATYRFLQTEHVEMHVGAGVRFLIDNGHDRAGFNMLYSFDFFPTRPLHVFGSVELGGLGNATVWRLHGGAGWNWDFAELFAGYDYVNVGGAVLQGPMIGLRLWF